MADGKRKIGIKTMQRRKYNSIIDGHKKIPDYAKEYMRRKPYSTDGG